MYMDIGAHTITPKENSARSKKRVGRGNGSQKGTYAGRGLKGQKSRSGSKSGRSVAGAKQAILKVPKLRGFKSPHPKAQSVTLATLERVAKEGVLVTPFFLKEIHIVKSTREPVKIVGSGELKKKVTITGCLATKSAVAAIEKAGGTITF